VRPAGALWEAAAFESDGRSHPLLVFQTGRFEVTVGFWHFLLTADHFTMSTSSADEPPRRSIPMIIAISAAQLAMQVAYSMEYSLSNPLMGKLGMPQWSYALVVATDPLTGLFVQPLFGSLSDRCRSKWGRRRPFILLGSCLLVVCLILLILTENIGRAISETHWVGWGRAVLIVSLLGYNVALNGMQNPSRTVIQDLVPESQRVQGNFVGSVGVAFGFCVVNLIGALNLSKYMDYTNEQIVLVTGGVLFVVAVVVTLIFAKEEQYSGVVQEEPAVLETFKAVVHCPKPVWRAGVCLFMALFVFVPFQVVCTDYFGIDVYGGWPTDPDSPYDDGVAFGMLVLTVVSAIMMVYCFFADRVVERIGVRWAFAMCEILDVISFTSVIYTRNKWALLVLMLPAGLSFGSAVALPYAVVGLSVPQESLGLYLGVLNIAIEAGGELGLLVFQLGFGALSNKRWPTIGAAGIAGILAAISPYFLITPKQIEDIGQAELTNED
jgi:Na+/melibiose symporter-like transporter